MESMEFRKSVAELRAIWVLGNEYLTKAAPWTTIKTDRNRAAASVRMGLNLVHLFGHLSWPFIPESAKKIHEAVMEAPDLIPWPDELMAQFLDGLNPGQPIHPPDVLFAKITDEQTAAWETRFGGPE
jgi:methionyl-tRNA synthetase